MNLGEDVLIEVGNVAVGSETGRVIATFSHGSEAEAFAELVNNEDFTGRKIKELVELLIEAKDLFRMYEKSHRDRGLEHLEKAERNAAIASKIEAALYA